MQEYRYTIGKLSRLTAIPVDTIRYYTELQFLHPEVNGTYHYYSNEDIYVLYYIRSLRSVGFSLSEVKEMLKGGSEGTVQEVLADKIHENMEKIQREQDELEYMQGLLKETEICSREPGVVRLRDNVSFGCIAAEHADLYGEETLEAWVSAIPFAQPYLTWNRKTDEKHAGGFAMFDRYEKYIGRMTEHFACDRALCLYLAVEQIQDGFEKAGRIFQDYAEVNGLVLDDVLHCFLLEAELVGDRQVFMVQYLCRII